MKLRSKLSLWSAGSAVMMLVIAGIAWYCVNRLLNSAEDVAHTYDVIIKADKIHQNIELLEYEQELYLTFHNVRKLDEYNETTKKTNNDINELAGMLRTPAQINLLKESQTYLAQWTARAEKEIFGIKEPNKLDLSNEIMDKLVSLDPTLVKAKTALETFQKNEEQLMNERKTGTAYVVSWILATVLVSTLLIVIIHSLLSFAISSKIRKSLDNAISKMKDIAEGSADLTKTIKPYTNDELAEFADHFNNFTEKLRSIVREIQGEAVVMHAFSDELSASSTNLANQSVSTSSALDHMTSAMEDLKQTTETNYTETTKNLNKNEENITDFIKNVSFDNNAQRADELATELKFISENTLEINNKIQKIEETIKAVNEISKQSNILSVNASIQANKSGEYGLPFTVIAGEIKALAESSGIVIKNAIAELKETQQMSNKMALSIERLDKALKDYAKKASLYNFNVMEKSHVLQENTNAIQRLSNSRKTQLEGLKLLTSAMDNIKDSSAGNAANARRLEDVAMRIDELVKSLKQQSDNFKT